MPTPAVKNSKMINEKPTTNKKYATHGVTERVRELLPEVELVEAHDLVRLAPAIEALADHVGRVEHDLFALHRYRDCRRARR